MTQSVARVLRGFIVNCPSMPQFSGNAVLAPEQALLVLGLALAAVTAMSCSTPDEAEGSDSAGTLASTSVGPDEAPLPAGGSSATGNAGLPMMPDMAGAPAPTAGVSGPAGGAGGSGGSPMAGSGASDAAGAPASTGASGGGEGAAEGGAGGVMNPADANAGGVMNVPGTGNAGSGGSTGGAGTGGVASGGAASGGVASGGVASGGAGTGGAGGADEDPLPPRPLDVTVAEGRHEHSFRASEADPAVSFNDNTEIAVLDNRAATLMGKLVLPFGGLGSNAGTLTGAGEFCARRGFHVLAVAAFQDYDIVSHGADFFGDARRTAFEGTMYTHEDAFADIEMTPADGVAQRTQKALQYLHSRFPEEDWGYYLQEDGSVRWSDVIFTGMSHGASNSARFAFLVRASRVVSSSGPRDNLCTRVDLDDCGGVFASWLDEVPKTPIERFYAITGTSDSQHTQHLFTMEKLGYVGEPTVINGAQPPYGDSHRLVTQDGHVDFCGRASYEAVCNYAFGVPPENQAGTGP